MIDANKILGWVDMPIGASIKEGACINGEAGASPGAIFMPGCIPGAAT